MLKVSFLRKPAAYTYLKSATAKLHISSSKLAGHSKWANIKHTKGLKDAQRAALFSRLSRYIRMAVQGKYMVNPY